MSFVAGRAMFRQDGILDRQIALWISGSGEGIGIDTGGGPGSRHERGIVDQPQSWSRMTWTRMRLGLARRRRLMSRSVRQASWTNDRLWIQRRIRLWSLTGRGEWVIPVQHGVLVSKVAVVG